MAERNIPIKIYFQSSALANSEHLNENTNYLIGQLNRVISGLVLHNFYGDKKSGALHPEHFKLEAQLEIEVFIKINPGIGVVYKDGIGQLILMLADTVMIDTDALSNNTYYVYLKYLKQTSDDVTFINPISGEEVNAVEIQYYNTGLIDYTGDFGSNNFVILSTTQATEVEEHQYGLLYIGSFTYTGSGISDLKGGKLLPVRLPFPDDDPDNRLADGVTPSVTPYTDLFNFLACKGNAPRTVTNPFGIAYEDVGGSRDYYSLLTVSGILKGASNDYLTLQPNRDDTDNTRIKIHRPLLDDYLIVGGVKSDTPATLIIEPPYTSDADYYYIEFPTHLNTYELWFLVVWYDETIGQFYLRWAKGDPDDALDFEWNKPFYSTNNIDDLDGKVSAENTEQLIKLSGFPYFEKYFKKPEFLPILLIGWNGDLSTIGVFHANEDPADPVLFNGVGNPSDLRRYHFIDIKNIRLSTLPSDWEDRNKIEQELRKSLSDFLLWHIPSAYRDTSQNFRHDTTQIKSIFSRPDQLPDLSLDAFLKVHQEYTPNSSDYIRLITNTNADGKRFLHTADRIIRKSGFSYIQSSSDEQDVDSALNIISESILDLQRQGSYALFRIQPTGDLTEDTENLRSIINTINSVSDIKAAVILFTPYFNGSNIARFNFQFDGNEVYQMNKPVLLWASSRIEINGGNFVWNVTENSAVSSSERGGYIISGIKGGLWLNNGFAITGTPPSFFVLEDATFYTPQIVPDYTSFIGFFSEVPSDNCMWGSVYRNVRVRGGTPSEDQIINYMTNNYPLLPSGRRFTLIDRLYIENFDLLLDTSSGSGLSWAVFTVNGLASRFFTVRNSYFDIAVEVDTTSIFLEANDATVFVNSIGNWYNFTFSFDYFVKITEMSHVKTNHLGDVAAFIDYYLPDGSPIDLKAFGAGNQGIPAPDTSVSGVSVKPTNWSDLNW